MKEIEFCINIIQQYRNTPLLDKITNSKELPIDIKDYFLFENKLNLKFINNITKFLHEKTLF